MKILSPKNLDEQPLRLNESRERLFFFRRGAEIMRTAMMAAMATPLSRTLIVLVSGTIVRNVTARVRAMMLASVDFSCAMVVNLSASGTLKRMEKDFVETEAQKSKVPWRRGNHLLIL